MRVLIVEDEPTSARLLEATISHFADCQRAANGQECFEKFCSAVDSGKPFDLIFLDIMMPGVDGQEALAAIREVEESSGVTPEAGVKIVMTTALDDPQSLYHAHFAGCSEYLVKPIRREDLMRTLKRLGLNIEPAQPKA